MSISEHQPSVNLYNIVRAGFVAQGTTMGKWCRANDVNPTNARACLVGVWDGPKGKNLRDKIIDASRIHTVFAVINEVPQQGVA